MITANVGLPGSGKSLAAVGRTIIPALKERRLVVTNIPVHVHEMSRYLGFDCKELLVLLDEYDLGRLPFSDVTDFTKHESWRSEGTVGHGCVIVIDEAHKCLTECYGLQANSHPIVQWFAEHRHTGIDVVLLTQGRIDIPPALRRRCEYVYEFRSLKSLGMTSKYICLTYYGKSDEAQSKETGTYDKEWFPLYKSHGKGVAEKMPKVKNILINSRTLFALFAIIGIACYLFSNGVHMPGAKPVATKPSQTQEHPAGGVLAAAQNAIPGAAAPKVDSPEIEDLRKRLEAVKLKAELDLVEHAHIPHGGELRPGAAGVDGGSSMVWTEAPDPLRHKYDGAEFKITGYMAINGQADYFLDVRRNGAFSEVVTTDGLIVNGFKLIAVNRCLAYLRGDHGSYRVDCNGWAAIGDAVKSTAQASNDVEEVLPDGSTVTNLKPVTASE